MSKRRALTKQSMGYPDVPLATEAAALLARIMPIIETRLEEVDHIPVSVLLWGPGAMSKGPLSSVRWSIRAKLRNDGHAAVCSEEICKPGAKYSIRLQQLVQAQSFDLIVSIPYTSGSIGEIHDFAADRRISSKILIFLNRKHARSYSSQSLKAISTVGACRIEYYPSEKNTSHIEEKTSEEVQQIREAKYLLAGRI